MKESKKLPYLTKLLIAMGIYAGVFIALAAFGLTQFWGYMDAYEHSQSRNAIDSYIAQLDASHIQTYAEDLIASVDHNIQSEEDCRQVLDTALRGGVTYARKLSECTDDKMVYMLMSNGKTIGKVILAAQETDAYGFISWRVQEESFDFSCLLGKSTSVTVPQDYSVTANGHLLGETYIVNRDTPFELLKDFYNDYTLPCLVTYEVPPVLGDVQVVITDPDGNTVTPEDAVNEALVLNNCTDTEAETLDTFAANYIGSYVRFSTNANEALQENYNDLLSYIVPGSALADRMYDALGGMKWVKNQTAQITSTAVHHRIRLPEDYYLYDLTYEVKIVHYGEATTVSNNVRLILKQEESGLKVERMINY